MSYEMNDLLSLMIEEDASDLHIQVGKPPTLRVSGTMESVEGRDLTPEDTEALMCSIASEYMQEEVKTKGGADFGFSFMENTRFRVSLLKARGNYGIVLRRIPNSILPFEKIGLPDNVKSMLRRPRGLILVTGPTGSGKSTTLASMIDWLNVNKHGHIITIESPIEYVIRHKNCIVTQREVGIDVGTFSDAVRGALRQDPDIIMVGEMRDLETIEAAIGAAETGHLVLATLHTTGAARTVDRIVDAFPSTAKDEIRTQLASTLIGVVSQTLLKKVGGGVVAGFEIMHTTDAISALIRDNKAFRITSEIQTGANLGMITLDSHLQSLYARGIIKGQDALDKAQYPDELRKVIKVEVGAN